jgi:hypothetical protein
MIHVLVLVESAVTDAESKINCFYRKTRVWHEREINMVCSVYWCDINCLASSCWWILPQMQKGSKQHRKAIYNPWKRHWFVCHMSGVVEVFSRLQKSRSESHITGEYMNQRKQNPLLLISGWFLSFNREKNRRKNNWSYLLDCPFLLLNSFGTCRGCQVNYQQETMINGTCYVHRIFQGI